MAHKALKDIMFALLALPLTLRAGSTLAQQAKPAPGVAIELSATQDEGAGCRVSFLIQNRHPSDIASAVYETVLFGEQGQVVRMALLDFQELPADRPRVRQFHFPDMACAQISRVLINGAERCEAPGLDDKACVRDLDLSTRTKTELIG
ncbi:hypothetical protein [Falsiruegeria mediterranea]|uniref:Tat pathway signal sequence domain protein n=1 Tax=Falsiruegeria mediterranea M17 TaxID=1200281 RepID=A0A2R8CE53_9RHOB|nr:hypothetical protein [Falsiruegeria mediterranea]SPJ30695.1 hypothetical protein TRM7615_04229 [Falsiruegeria mediterranea M17]